MPDIKHKISFCIVSMNRLHHLRETLPANILDNEDYENLEFVILDYNSSDSLDLYIKETMSEHLKTGRIVYYRTTTPKYFNRSHSRNVAYKLASGDIICNIDADNFTGKGFASYVSKQFADDESVFLTFAIVSKNSDVYGRNCVRRTDFYNIKGYDERMINYGFEDYDFFNRLELCGVTRKPIDQNYAGAIKHSATERLSNEFSLMNLDSLYANYLTPSSTGFLFLYKNNEFKQGTLINNSTYSLTGSITDLHQSQLKYPYSFLGDFLAEGTWVRNESKITLIGNGGKVETLYYNQDKLCFSKIDKDETMDFYMLTELKLIESIVMLFCQMTNRVLMDQNIIEKQIVVNDFDFGKEVVYKNFDYQSPITT